MTISPIVKIVGGVSASIFMQQINNNFESLRQQNNINMAYLFSAGITSSITDRTIDADLIQFPNGNTLTADDLNANFAKFKFSEVNQLGTPIPCNLYTFLNSTKLNPDDLNQNFSRVSKIINQQSETIIKIFADNGININIKVPITAIMTYDTSLGGRTAAFSMTGLTEPPIAGNEGGRGLISWGDGDTISWDILANGANTHTYSTSGVKTIIVTSQNQTINTADFRLVPSGKVAGDASGWTAISLQNKSNQLIQAFHIGSSLMTSDIKNSHLVSFNCVTPHNMTDMSNKFANCSSLLSVKYPSNKVITNAQNMYYNCTSMQNIIMNDQTTSCTNFISTFEGCTSLAYVDWFSDSETTAQALTTARMYYGCNNFLQNRAKTNTSQIDINVNSSIDCTDMYNGCTSMIHARVNDFSFFTLGSSRILTRMFYNCTHMLDFKPNGGSAFGLVAGGTLYSGITFDLTDMFYGCTALTDGVMLGTQSDVDYSHCPTLTESALVDIFNNLSVV